MEQLSWNPRFEPRMFVLRKFGKRIVTSEAIFAFGTPGFAFESQWRSHRMNAFSDSSEKFDIITTSKA
jgi:hypothetical protein